MVAYETHTLNLHQTLIVAGMIIVSSEPALINYLKCALRTLVMRSGYRRTWVWRAWTGEHWCDGVWLNGMGCLWLLGVTAVTECNSGNKMCNWGTWCDWVWLGPECDQVWQGVTKYYCVWLSTPDWVLVQPAKIVCDWNEGYLKKYPVVLIIEFFKLWSCYKRVVLK